MSKYAFLPFTLLLMLVLTLPAAPAFSAETVDVILHVENQSKETASIAVDPLSYTSWEFEKVLSAGQQADMKYTETLSAGGASISYELFVSRLSGELECQFWYRFDHGSSRQLILSEPQFRNCQFDSSVSHSTYRDGNKMYLTIIIK